MREQVNYFLEDDKELPGKVSTITSQADNKNSLLVLDDMISSQNMQYFVNLFTVQARHRKMSVIFLSQMMFSGGKTGDGLKGISHNADYLILQKTKRNVKGVATLFQQISPFNWQTMLNIYQEATGLGTGLDVDEEEDSKNRYSYLLYDMTQSCPDHLKFRSHLFDEPGLVKVYVEN